MIFYIQEITEVLKMKYGNYDDWKLDNPYENEVESYESEKFGYWSMDDTLVMKFNDLIEEYKGNDLEEYAENIADELGLSISYERSLEVGL
jgi:hypothetical protein